MPRREPAAHPPPYHHGDLRRALVAAAMSLVVEDGDWSFSLRAVARRAGVSHNAPYNHFADKRALLAAVAEAGFDALRLRMSAAAEGAGSPDAALVAIGLAYIGFGVECPAHYRLMFGPTLMAGADGPPPTLRRAAGAAKAVLRAVVLAGGRGGAFAAAPDDERALEAHVAAAWALVHGLVLLGIDGLQSAAGTDPSLAAAALRALLDGVRRR